MRYPGSTKVFHKKISHANRGMVLEELINSANKYYLENDVALIYKKPTPIGIVNVKNDGSQKIITKAFFKEPSTLDYNGIYKGKYIEFDAKETKSKTSFPLANISPHQIDHIKKILKHGGIAFLIISINQEYYILNGLYLIKFMLQNKRKSIPYFEITKHGYRIHSSNKITINYLEQLDKIIGGLQYEIKN